MRLRSFSLSLVAVVLFVTAASQARADKGDIYFGYSRAGANLYAVYTPAMNGWQAAAHVKLIPFLGVEGDVSRYSQTVNGYSQQVTLAMFGPRLTVRAAGVSLFAHGLAGVAHQHATIPFLPSVGYNATSYALGGGADLPLWGRIKARVSADFLGNSDAPDSSYSPEHYRFGLGVAYHF